MTGNTTHTIVMTGASRGIGAVAAEKILRDDPLAHLVVLGRGRGLALPRTIFVETDLASTSATVSAAREVSALLASGDLPPLVGFLGNAGIQYADAETVTTDGLEATFAVNVVANHVLIDWLRGHFDAQSRIVITVSDTHFGDLRHNLGLVPGPVWSAPEVLSLPGAFAKPNSVTAGRTAYSTSKLAAIYLVHALARSVPRGVDVVSFNPGFVPGTDLARNADAISRFVMKRVLPVMTRTRFATTPAQAGAALAEVMLGTVAAGSGDYVDRRCVVPSSDESYDEKREDELMAFLRATTPPVRA
ncbi:SDR family NAD(P)-dependent oxidoreductase [Rhodococcoides yunnanense]|uniref:SDR family NAD(P)-dependent oxidoreductase n=1 Tax=Rhodococcoides yunnanense TaxID=278209 RepID=UPI00157D1AB6|nr:SDR family NAD(P)-dependent oxidoreductase [Rhodococcus yunnanensis]